MIVSLYWMEPESESWICEVTDATDEELREVRDWVKKQAGDEYGNTIPSIRLTPGQVNETQSKISFEDFAAAVRYASGDELFQEDCPAFKSRGIERS